MALNYRFNKKGKVTGVGWGRGENYEAGMKKIKKDNEAARNRTKSSSKKTKKVTARKTMEQENRAIHGDKKIDALKIKAKKFKDNRAEMQRLRKNNPEEYKKRKKKQRKAENLASFTAGSHTWD